MSEATASLIAAARDLLSKGNLKGGFTAAGIPEKTGKDIVKSAGNPDKVVASKDTSGGKVKANVPVVSSG